MANIFLIVSTEPEHTMPKEAPADFADYLRVSDKACLVLAKGVAPTTKDVSEAMGIGPPPNGVMGVAVSVDAYYGYETPTIWEKLKKWEMGAK